MTLPDGQQRLRIVISSNAVLTVMAGAFTIAMSVTAAKLPWLTVAGIVVLATAVAQAAALRPLGRNDTARALAVYSAASWGIALTSTFIVTFQWPVQVPVALLPMVLVATFMPDRPIGQYVWISVVVGIGVVALGLGQDVTGLSDEIPSWMKALVQVVVVPGFSALFVFAIVQHHRRVNDVLDSQRAAHALAERRAEDLERSRRRLVQATDRARRSIERDLHDGAQSHLVGIDLQLTRAMTLDDLEPMRQAIRLAQHEVHRAHGELRDLALGLFPPVLTQHGLVPALEDAADRCPLPVRLDLVRIGRASPDVESAVYFCVMEAMQNAVKHSNGTTVTITVQPALEPGAVCVSVGDDGIGLPDVVTNGQGLDNIQDRLGAVGGTVEFSRSPAGGAMVAATVPW